MFNDENVKFLKSLSCELKVAQNGSKKVKIVNFCEASIPVY